MHRKTRLIFALSCLMLLTACLGEEVHRGYIISEEQLAAVKPGESSQTDVLQILGSPSTTSEFEVERWHYFSQDGTKVSILNPSIAEQRIITVEFDQIGIVSMVEEKGLTDTKQVAYIRRKTPAAGGEFSVMDQLIGNLGRFNSGQTDRASGGGATR